MTCLASPQTVAEFADVIDRCATAYGGPGWPTLALTGLATIAIAGLVLLVLLAVLRRA